MALLIVAIVVLASLFFFIHIIPPSGPAKITKPPTPPPNSFGPFFQNETPMPSIMNVSGSTIYDFSYSGNATTVIRGTMINGSSHSPIAGGDAYISLYPAGAISKITTGKFLFTALRAGIGNFIFHVPGYSDVTKQLTLGQGTVVINLTLNPVNPVDVKGKTVFENGSIAANCNVQLSGFFSTTGFTSNANGVYSIPLYCDSYNITVLGKNVNPRPVPYYMVVPIYNSGVSSGPSLSNFIITIYPLNVTEQVSGYVKNITGPTVSGASVLLIPQGTNTTTDSAGYYKIAVPYGYDTLIASKPGVGVNKTTYFFTKNVTNFNFTLIPLPGADPFNSTSQSIPPSSYNASNYLGNNSSNVNYSKPGNYALVGFVNNSLHGLPVALTQLNFIINVNGTYYQSFVPTALNGSYIVLFRYAGEYKIYVNTTIYKPIVFAVNITAHITYKNFTLTPQLSYVHNITGTVYNRITHLPVSGATVKALLYSQPKYNVTATISSNGHYGLSLTESNYSIVASAPGYLTNTTNGFFLSANLVLDLNLTPITALNNTWTDQLIPGLSISYVKSQLTSAGNYTSSQFYNLTILAVNASNAQPVVNTQFLVIYKISGAYYYIIANSNASGFLYMPGLEGGSYAFFVASINYDSATFSLTLSTPYSVQEQVNLTPRTMYQVNILAVDGLSGIGLNKSVPTATFVITNSSLNIGINAATGSNGTLFEFEGYNATFNVSYTNIHYELYINSIPVTGAPVSMNVSLTPYAVNLTFTSESGFWYSLNSAAGAYVNPSNGSIVILAKLGTNTLSANISHSSHVYSKVLILSNATSYQIVYFNVSAHSELLNTTGYNYYTPATGNYSLYVMNTSLSASQILFGGNISLNLSGVTFYVNSFQENYSYSVNSSGKVYSLFNFLQYYYAPAGTLSIMIKVPAPKPPNNLLSGFNLYYFEASIA